MIFLCEEGLSSGLVATLVVCEIEDQSKTEEFKHFTILNGTEENWRKWQKEDIQHESEEKLDVIADESKEDLIPKKIKREEQSKRKSTMREKGLQEISEFIQSDIDEQLMDDVNLIEFLELCGALISELSYIDQKVAPCFPPYYKITQFYVELYVTWIIPRIINRIDLEKTAAKDCPLVVKLIGSFRTKIQQFSMENSPNWQMLRSRMNALENLQEELMNIYIRKWTFELEDRVKRIVDLEKDENKREIFVDPEGKPRTHAPQDLFGNIAFLIKTASESLDGQPMIRVIELFLSLQRLFASLMSDYIMSGRNLREKHLFALVNNFEELAKQVAGQQDIIFPEEGGMDWKNLSVADREEVQIVFDDVESTFHELGNKCLDIIVEKTITDYLLPVFQPTWLSTSNKENMQNVVATLEESFVDWEEKLATIFLIGRMKEKVCESVVKCYMNMFLRLSTSSRLDPDELSLTIDRDYRLLSSFLVPDGNEKMRLVLMQHMRRMDSVSWFLSSANDVQSKLVVDRKLQPFFRISLELGVKIVEHALRLRGNVDANKRSTLSSHFRNLYHKGGIAKKTRAK